MTKFLLVLTVLLLLVGCSLGDSGIRYGTPITSVQADLGLPDVISDESGDQRRFYLPVKRPKHEWPADAPRTFYYLDRDIQVVFVNGKAVRATKIEPGIRERILLPLVRRASAVGS